MLVLVLILICWIFNRMCYAELKLKNLNLPFSIASLFETLSMKLILQNIINFNHSKILFNSIFIFLLMYFFLCNITFCNMHIIFFMKKWHNIVLVNNKTKLAYLEYLSRWITISKQLLESTLYVVVKNFYANSKK